MGRIFDRAADRYHRARPRYPDELFAMIERAVGPLDGRRVFEIGPATGVASEALVARGARVTAVEPGPELAAVWSQQFGPTITVAEFEAVEPEPLHDLVVAATCWHWLDPDRRVQLAVDHLRPGGWLAIWSANHVFPDDADPIFDQLQSVYDEIGEGRDASMVPPTIDDLPDLGTELSGDERLVEVRTAPFQWFVDYSADAYVDLLSTFSGHLAMKPWQWNRLESEIRRLLDERADGLLRRHWGARLHLARRSDG